MLEEEKVQANKEHTNISVRASIIKRSTSKTSQPKKDKRLATVCNFKRLLLVSSHLQSSSIDLNQTTIINHRATYRFQKFERKMLSAVNLNNRQSLHLKISDRNIPSPPPNLSTSDEHHLKTSITSSNNTKPSKTIVFPSSSHLHLK